MKMIRRKARKAHKPKTVVKIIGEQAQSINDSNAVITTIFPKQTTKKLYRRCNYEHYGLVMLPVFNISLNLRGHQRNAKVSA